VTNTADPETVEPAPEPGRVALVTGGSGGIGRVIAQHLTAEGFRVAATFRGGAVPPGILGVQCDVTDVEQVDAAFAAVESQLGPVEVLVANAGITRDTLLMRMSEEDWDSVIETNLTGTFHVVRRAARLMVRARFGRIVLISSVVGQFGSAGQVGMARSLARELGGRGITANVVAPGFIETEMTAVLDEKIVAGYQAQIPLGRMGTSDDVAAAVAFLAGPGGAYVTGALLAVDGGLGMGH
jgi:3-oxoacyl-[acyl-carrier protein] reductase